MASRRHRTGVPSRPSSCCWQRVLLRPGLMRAGPGAHDPHAPSGRGTRQALAAMQQVHADIRMAPLWGRESVILWAGLPSKPPSTLRKRRAAYMGFQGIRQSAGKPAIDRSCGGLDGANRARFWEYLATRTRRYCGPGCDSPDRRCVLCRDSRGVPAVRDAIPRGGAMASTAWIGAGDRGRGVLPASTRPGTGVRGLRSDVAAIGRGGGPCHSLWSRHSIRRRRCGRRAAFSCYGRRELTVGVPLHRYVPRVDARRFAPGFFR